MTARNSPLRVVGAVAFRSGGLVYASKRPPGGRHGGLWEFPGGKVEPNETDELALEREIFEELGVSATVGHLLATGSDQDIELHCYKVTFEDEPVPEPPRLGAWFSSAELSSLDMPPADWPARDRAIECLAGRT